MKYLSLVIAALATVACRDKGSEEPKGDESHKSTFAQYDQILVEVRATPATDSAEYMIDVRNYGHGKVTFWWEVKQQWCQIEDSISPAKGWNEKTASNHAVGSFDLEPEQEVQMIAIPAARSGVILRFGVVFKCQDQDDFRKLVVWSNPVNPESAPWNQNAEQAGTGQPATRPESKPEGSDKPQPEADGRSR
jgi:hypothetical protein